MRAAEPTDQDVLLTNCMHGLPVEYNLPVVTI